MTRCTATRPTPGLLWRGTPTMQGCPLDEGHEGEHEWHLHPEFLFEVRQERAAEQAERDALVAQGRRAMHDEMLIALARMANEHGGTEWGRALWSAHERLKTEVKP